MGFKEVKGLFDIEILNFNEDIKASKRVYDIQFMTPGLTTFVPIETLEAVLGLLNSNQFVIVNGLCEESSQIIPTNRIIWVRYAWKYHCDHCDNEFSAADYSEDEAFDDGLCVKCRKEVKVAS